MSNYEIRFEPLQEKRLSLLHNWFKDPEVKKWYARGIEFSFQDIEKKYMPRILGKDNTPSFIVFINHQAVGFIQYYSLVDHLPEGVGLNNELFSIRHNAKICGMDIFIGEKNFRGKGLGRQIILTFIKQFLLSSFSHIVVDPTKVNLSAISCYKGCGFKETSYSEDEEFTILVKEINDKA